MQSLELMAQPDIHLELGLWDFGLSKKAIDSVKDLLNTLISK